MQTRGIPNMLSVPLDLRRIVFEALTNSSYSCVVQQGRPRGLAADECRLTSRRRRLRYYWPPRKIDDHVKSLGCAICLLPWNLSL